MFPATRDAVYKSSGHKCYYMPRIYAGHITCKGERYMINGHFYFVQDSFYNSLPDCNLMSNKGHGIPGIGGRPCHYCFKYEEYYWMVPISSKTQKYHSIYNNKVAKRGYCDTIRFGYVNGVERVFLIQNCFPITQKFIDSEYKVNKNTIPVTVTKELANELNGLLRKVIRLYKKGINMPLTKLDEIISYLEQNR